MAMIDYGAIAFKNGKLISTDMFTPMIDMVGWEDTKEDKVISYCIDADVYLNFKGNYYAYIGDKDCTIGFYKTSIDIAQKASDNIFGCHHISFDNSGYTWLKWEKYISGNLKITKRNGYYVCKWKYKGDKYKVYFGYGVDLDYYKKYHIVNYYRSPEFIFKHKIPSWIKDKISDFTYYLKERF